jgi:chorismate mutase
LTKNQIKATQPKIDRKNAQISTLAKERAVIKQKYAEHKFRFWKKSRQPEHLSDPSNITGLRPSVKAFMRELRQKADEENHRKEELKKLRAIKPKRMLMITSSWQKKRSLAAVIGKKYRRTAEDMRPISALPVKKTQKVG